MASEKPVICIFTKGDPISLQTEFQLRKKLEFRGFELRNRFDPSAELIVCIGGDGSFLKTVHECGFADIPYVGINTGHLGFFQEFQPDSLDAFIESYLNQRYSLQTLEVLTARFQDEDGPQESQAINEIVIRGAKPRTIHLDLSIGDSRIQRFSGDGLLISTPAGSTAYNYALGGSIVDPRLALLQVTPISPMNTTAYRSFTSSVLLPADMSVLIEPEKDQEKDVLIIGDGLAEKKRKEGSIEIFLSGKQLRLMRLETYRFWNKVKSKFL